MITNPTHPGLSPSLMDHLIPGRPELTSNARVVSCDIGDHDLITALITDAKPRRALETITIRSTRRVDHNALCLSLLQADWSKFNEADSVSEKWNSFLAV